MNEKKALLQAKASTTQYNAVWANCEGVKVEKEGKSVQENRGRPSPARAPSDVVTSHADIYQ